MAKREPNAVEVTPSGIEIAYYDSIGLDGEPQQRRYLIDGKRLVNVTTILNTLSKGDALLHWAVNLEREGKDWREVRDEAAQRGTNSHHLLLQVLTKGRAGLADLPDAERPYGQAAFRWLRHAEPDVEMTECMVASVEHGFAGRFDLLATIDGARTLVDFKTVTKWSYSGARSSRSRWPGRRRSSPGKKRPPYEENLLQLDLYQQGLAESGYEPAERGLIVRLGPDGTFDETPVDLEPTRGLGVLAAYQAKKLAGKALRSSAVAA